MSGNDVSLLLRVVPTAQFNDVAKTDVFITGFERFKMYQQLGILITIKK